MAKQSGLIKIKGAIEDLTFLKTKDGHLVRQKGKVVTRDEIANGKQYARMRENMDEFGRATEAGRLFRLVFTDSMLYCVDKTLVSRTTKIMSSVLLSDPVSDRGERNVMNGDARLLKDFLLNSGGEFTNICKQEYNATIDRVTGKLTFAMSPFVPADVIAAMPGSTHFQFYSAAAAINFDTGEFEIKHAVSAPIVNDSKLPTLQYTEEHQLTAASTNPLFLAAGIRFSQEVNGKFYPFYNSAFNTLAIAEADAV
jgi:hypothetical protein